MIPRRTISSVDIHIKIGSHHLGQGNVFTPVCHSVHGVCVDLPTPLNADPLDADPPPRYGQQAGGTHPTRMRIIYASDFWDENLMFKAYHWRVQFRLL